MSKIALYRKAIVAASGGLIAVAVAIWRGDAPDSIPGATETLIGVITTMLVYAFPNEDA